MLTDDQLATMLADLRRLCEAESDYRKLEAIRNRCWRLADSYRMLLVARTDIADQLDSIGADANRRLKLKAYGALSDRLAAAR